MSQCLGDTRVVKKKEEGKIEHYRDTGIEIGRIWKKKANTVPIVIGTLGTISKNHLMSLGELECNISFETIQKTVLLRTSEELCIDWPVRPLISR